jgi:hypothetical protein
MVASGQLLLSNIAHIRRNVIALGEIPSASAGLGVGSEIEGVHRLN